MWTREEIIAGLIAGKVLIVDRKDSPALPITALQEEGLVETELRQIDEQSSHLRVTWKGPV